MIPAVILAAGASRRMGYPKALLPIGGDVFVTRLAASLAAGGATRVLVVASEPTEPVRRAVAGLDAGIEVLENQAPERGQLSSLVIALDWLGSEVPALMSIPVDMPLVAPSTIQALIDAYRHERRPVVRPVSGHRHGHPVVFDGGLFEELRRADPSAGARAVVAAHRAQILDVPVTDPGAFVDIDTRGDYERHIGRWPFGRP